MLEATTTTTKSLYQITGRIQNNILEEAYSFYK